MNPTVKISQVIINVLPTPNVCVLSHEEYADDTGNLLFTRPLLGRDVTTDDAQAAAFDPVIATQQATITAQAAQIADLQKQVAATPTVAPTVTASDTLLNQLNGVFATIPVEYQAQFANEYATVRVLIQAGQPKLAAAVVESVTVPDEMAAIKAQILAALQS